MDRRAASVLLLLGFALAAPAQEPPAEGPKLIEYEWQDWEGRIAGIRDSALTTLDKTKQIRDLASEAVVVFRGKIRDIAPSRQIEGGIDLICCGRWGGEPSQTFTFRPPHVSQIDGWRKWDRVTWRAYPVARDLEIAAYNIVFKGADDLHREPDPGVERLPLPAAKTSWSSWRRSYERHVRAGDFERAWKKIEEVLGTYWGTEGVVARVDKYPDMDECYLWLSSPEAAVGRSLRVTDPQAKEALAPGQKIVLAFGLAPGFRGAEGVRNAQGRCDVEFAYWGIE